MIELIESLKSGLLANFGWVYSVSGFITFAMCIGLLFSPIRNWVIPGERKLGNLSYYSMIGACGMGVSLLGWAMLEPYYHIQSGMGEVTALSTTLVNWAPAWSIYAAFGIAYALLTQRYNMKSTVGVFSKVSLVVVTVLGLVLTYVYILRDLKPTMLGGISEQVLIIVLTVIAMISSASGVFRGIKWLSQINLVVVLIILSFVVYTVSNLGTVELGISGFISSLVDIPLTLNTIGMFSDRADWLADWTYAYYSAWWGWVVFSGIFVAKISAGRSLSEVVFGTVIIPFVVTVLWFTVFTDAYLQLGTTNIPDLLQFIPGGEYVIVIFSLSMVLFFLTSVDSAGLVLEELTDIKNSRCMWILLMALVASFMVELGGDSVSLVRTIVGLTSFPLVIIAANIIWKAFLQVQKELDSRYLD